MIDNDSSRIAVAALAGATVAVSLLKLYETWTKTKRIQALKKEASREISSGSFQRSKAPGVRPPEELIREQLTRNYSFLGEEPMEKVRKSFVIVVGVGGVGSHCAHMLIRSGVEKIRLIDFDQITLSSLNRHAVATHDDVGISKVDCLVKHFKEISPQVQVEARMELFNVENAPRLLSGKPDFVLDCIDNIDTKIELIQYCHDNGLRILASMGAGAKSDPSRVQIADISETFEDPLARVTRKGLRMKGIESGIPVVYSTEKPSVKLLPLDESKVAEADQYATLPTFRSRILPVLGTLPALFGLAMAT
ncbi:hypothetical protein HDU76_011378 [Blyttiomyces sp. JEL0837]|nr:hypothetical protein HDU76_011378 [Blyttiomyces sp. JEL0837]